MMPVSAGLDALVVVVDGHRQRPLGLVLPDDVLLEEVVDLLRLRQFVELQVRGLRELFLDDLVAEVDALVADVDPGASDELLDLLLALPAERALEQVTALTDSCHLLTSTSGGFQAPGVRCPPVDGADVPCSAPLVGEALHPATRAGDRTFADRTCWHRPRRAMTRPAGTAPEPHASRVPRRYGSSARHARTRPVPLRDLSRAA